MLSHSFPTLSHVNDNSSLCVQRRISRYCLILLSQIQTVSGPCGRPRLIVCWDVTFINYLRHDTYRSPMSSSLSASRPLEMDCFVLLVSPLRSPMSFCFSTIASVSLVEAIETLAKLVLHRVPYCGSCSCFTFNPFVHLDLTFSFITCTR